MKKPIKMLLIGDSKSGKTGSLASLLRAGYNVRMIDIDNNTNVLWGHLKGNTAALARLDVQTCSDGFVKKEITLPPSPSLPKGGKDTRLIPVATAWPQALNLFDKWPEWGPIETWGERDVLVIDSLSFLSQAALNFVLELNARFVGGTAFDTDIGDAQKLIRGLLNTIKSDIVKCHVVVITHIDYRGGSLWTDSQGKRKFVPDHMDLGVEKGFPMSLGKALNPIIATFFPVVLLAKLVGTGQSAKRLICTKPTTNGTATVDLASADPEVPAELPLESGLADYFRIVRGELTKEVENV